MSQIVRVSVFQLQWFDSPPKAETATLERGVTSAPGAGLTHAAVSAGLPRVSGGADAHEGPDQVLAGHASAGAVVQSGFALVVVWGRQTASTA